MNEVNNPMIKKTVINNAFWMIFQQLFKYAISFFVGVFIVRYLAPERFGVLTFILTVVTLFNPFIFLGSSSILPREITTNGKKNYLTSFVKLSYIIAIPLVFVISTIVLLSNYSYSLYLIIYSFSLLFTPLQIINYYNNSINQSKKTTKAYLYSNIISVIIKLVIVYFDLGLFPLLIAYLIDGILFGIFLLLGSKFNVYEIFNAKIKDIKQLKNSIVYNVVIAFSFILYTRIDQLMIKMILGDFDLGVYGSVVKIYDAYVMIGFTLTLSLISYLTKHKKMNLIINKIYKYLYLLFIPVSIILYFISDIITNTLYGEIYSGGSFSLKILFISAFFAIMTSLNNKLLIINNLEKIILKRVIFSLFINVVLNFILINKFGIDGAAFSTLFITIFSAIIYDLIDKKSFFLNKYKLLKND
ncbi:MAG: flippase [Flavobacteriaceae bacterium]|nr:flippase [Flavobacteriaceae bacterium]